MLLNGLKRYLPRGLYGRAALILVLPVVALQVVVSVVFIQRHFEGVTEQMSRTVAREIELVLDELSEGGPKLDEVTRTLQIDVVEQSKVPARDLLRWYDFTGRVVIRELRDLVPRIVGVQLPDDTQVFVYARTHKGVFRLLFERPRLSASSPNLFLVATLGVGALMTLIAYIYLRNQLRPITRLAVASEAFGRGVHVPYTASGALEVRAAGSAFLNMRERIERQIEQRTMMLSGVSHDLRTPLTRLKLGLSMLDHEDREPMERDVEDMRRLLDEFLNFARGMGEGEPEPVDIRALVAQIVQDAARAGQDVALTRAEDGVEWPVIDLRPVAVRRALENLINNAVRYGDRAEVTVRRSGRHVFICIEDDGPGIPPLQRDEAIKPFARLDPARNQDRGMGVGLGLAIAMDVARAHGGNLRLSESERLGGLRAEFMIAL